MWVGIMCTYPDNGPDLPRIAQKCTPTSTIVHIEQIVHTVQSLWLVQGSNYLNFQIFQFHAKLLESRGLLLRGLLISFHKVVPRFFIPFNSEPDLFFLFSRLESVESGLWSLDSGPLWSQTHGILRFETLESTLRQVLSSYKIDSTSVY